MAETKKCAHPSCTRSTKHGEQSCSAYCEGQKMRQRSAVNVPSALSPGSSVERNPILRHAEMLAELAGFGLTPSIPQDVTKTPCLVDAPWQNSDNATAEMQSSLRCASHSSGKFSCSQLFVRVLRRNFFQLAC